MDYPDILRNHHRRIDDRRFRFGMDLQTEAVAEVRTVLFIVPGSHSLTVVIGRSFAVAAAMFMNSNSLPIALMQSLVVTVPGLKWGGDDNKNAMVGRALTYLVLYSTLGMVVSLKRLITDRHHS